MVFKKQWIRLVLVGLLVAPGGAGLVHAQADDGALVFFETVSGMLTDRVPTNEWTFEGHASQIVSILAVTPDGELDPMIEVIGPTGAVVAQNDDLDSLVVDAGLEALSLPIDGTYTVRVARYGETAGRYELTLTPGFARVALRETFDTPESSWLPGTGDAVMLAQNRLRVRAEPGGTATLAFPTAAAPLQTMYFQVSAQLSANPSYAEAGLFFRGQDPLSGLPAYQFRVSSEGRWAVLIQDASGTFAVRSWTEDAALAGTAWTLGVLVRENDFLVYGNGVLLGTVSDTRLTGAGVFGVLAATRQDQTDPAVVLFDDVVITSRLGTTYRGMPLSLAAWESRDPRVIVTELAASEQISPAPARTLFVQNSALSTTNLTARFQTVGSEDAVYQDFVLGAIVNMATQGQSAGCGLVYRWQDERNMDLVYIDRAGGFGVVEARDAALTTNVYAHSPMVTGDAYRLLVIAQGDRLAYYINGALVTQETIQPGEGRIGVALLNYEDTVTDCFFSEIWVWPLVDAGAE